MAFYKNLNRKTLIWYIIFVITPFIIGQVFLLKISENNLKKNALSYIHLYSKQVDNSLDKKIEEYDRMIKSIMADKDVCDLLESSPKNELSSLERFENYRYIQQHFLKMITQQPKIEFIVILDNAKNIYPSLTYVNIPDIEDYTSNILYNEIIQENGKLVVTSGDFSQYGLVSKDTNALALSRLLKNLDGLPIGIGSLFLDLKQIENDLALGPQSPQYDSGVIVFDNNNNLIIDSAQLVKQNGLTKELLLSSANGENFLSTNQGEFMYVKQPKSRYGLTTIICSPTQSLFSVSNYYLRIFIAIIIIILLFASIFLYLFESHVTRPIKVLDTLTQEISSGNFNITTNIKSKDEIGSLANNFNVMVNKVNQLINEVYIKDIKQKQSELAALQNQINPHFLYNTLESIRMKAVINSDFEVGTMIKKLSRLFRITLSINSPKVMIKDELNHVSTYLDIINMRYDKTIKLYVNADDHILNLPILKLLLQPIVENSVLHGFNDFGYDNIIKINIHAKPYTNQCIIHIEDNGRGLNESDLITLKRSLAKQSVSKVDYEANSSIGLKNIYDRIMLEYGNHAEFNITSIVGKSFIVEITLPLSTE